METISEIFSTEVRTVLLRDQSQSTKKFKRATIIFTEAKVIGGYSIPFLIDSRM